MRVLIETYRGFEISFDTDEETFYTNSLEWDRENKKSSYAATKRWIDDFIKENAVFKPFWVEPTPGSHRANVRKRIIGVRKDGKAIAESGGKKETISSYDEDGYMLENPDNEQSHKELVDVCSQIDALHEKKERIKKQFIVVTLKDHLKAIKSQES